MKFPNLFSWRCQVQLFKLKMSLLVASLTKADAARMNTLSFATVAPDWGGGMQLLFRFSSKIVPYLSLLYLYLYLHLGRTFPLTMILFCLLQPGSPPYSWTKFGTKKVQLHLGKKAKTLPRCGWVILLSSLTPIPQNLTIFSYKSNLTHMFFQGIKLSFLNILSSNS